MIEFDSQNSFELDNSKAVENWLIAVANKEQFEIDEMGYVFCSDEYLLEINKQFLDHDTYTDIVTFDYSKEKILSGELYISTDRVAENADTFGTDFKTELSRVIVHGLLHICGYGDKTDEEIAIMRAKEEEYLILKGSGKY